MFVLAMFLLISKNSDTWQNLKSLFFINSVTTFLEKIVSWQLTKLQITKPKKMMQPLDFNFSLKIEDSGSYRRFPFLIFLVLFNSNMGYIVNLIDPPPPPTQIHTHTHIFKIELLSDKDCRVLLFQSINSKWHFASKTFFRL